MMLSEEKYKIQWTTYGFRRTVDITTWEWLLIRKVFLKMRSAYVKWCEEINLFEKLNQEFESMHCNMIPIKDGTFAAYLRGSWFAYEINKRLLDTNEITDAVSPYGQILKHLNLELDPIIFLDGEKPDFGCVFRQHPGWSIDILLVPVE